MQTDLQPSLGNNCWPKQQGAQFSRALRILKRPLNERRPKSHICEPWARVCRSAHHQHKHEIVKWSERGRVWMGGERGWVRMGGAKPTPSGGRRAPRLQRLRETRGGCSSHQASLGWWAKGVPSATQESFASGSSAILTRTLLRDKCEFNWKIYRIKAIQIKRGREALSYFKSLVIFNTYIIWGIGYRLTWTQDLCSCMAKICLLSDWSYSTLLFCASIVSLNAELTKRFAFELRRIVVPVDNQLK